MPEDAGLTVAIAREIEIYLATRPEGMDSLDGILRWWLPRVRLEESSAEVQRALDLLVARGSLVRSEVPGGRFVYGRAPGKTASLEKP